MNIEFTEFPKMARLSRECIITEKIDGTNAQIFITPGKNEPGAIHGWFDASTETDMVMFAGSRTRWVTPENDNYGFAAWVRDHRDELAGLPPGRHFGEWWGQGIQRKYGLPEKRLSFFNVSRFCLHGESATDSSTIELPPCVGLVPVLFRGTFDSRVVQGCLDELLAHGSVAAPGFMDPEGVVVYHVAANVGFKKTIHRDEEPKSFHKS